MSRRTPVGPRKEPRQERSRETTRALREAAARVLVREGPAGLNTTRVAEVAGVSVGSLYQYFPDKRALVAAVVEQRLEEDGSFVAELFRYLDQDPWGAVERLVDALCDRQRQASALMAALLPMLGEVERDAVARQTFAGMVASLVEVLGRRPDRLRPDLRDPDALRVAAFVLGASLRWAINEAVLQDPALLEDPRFRAELTRLGRSLLAVPEGG